MRGWQEGRVRLGLIALMVLVILALAAVVGGFQGWRMVEAQMDQSAGGGGEVEVVIPKGTTFLEALEILGDYDLLLHPQWVRLFARRHPELTKIKAGRYLLSPTMTPRQILEKLKRGVVELVSVTLQEGLRAREMVMLLERSHVTDGRAFLDLVQDAEYVQGLGIPAPTLEGYLFPDTYRFRVRESAERVVVTMVNQYRKVMDELMAEVGKLEAEVEQLTEHERVILASIVEKETGAPSERARVASVMYNRIARGWKLEMDSTVIYGIKDFDGDIKRSHLLDQGNRYSTYQHKGLPPGPIANPGRAALKAVLQPEKTPYMFFVSKNDGTHVFSRTRQEHERYVDIYQRRK